MTRESQHTEWKAAWHDDHLRWVCGFANAEGGRLEIGRDDTGAVVGVPAAAKLLEDLPNKIRDLLGIVAAVNLRHADGKDLIEIAVEAYPNLISYRGHYFVRSGSTLRVPRLACSTARSFTSGATLGAPSCRVSRRVQLVANSSPRAGSNTKRRRRNNMAVTVFMA